MKNLGKNLGRRYADMKSNDKKGFTLIELVVVIAIMAILALIMVPNLTAYIGKADEAKLHANLKNVHTAAEVVRQTSTDGTFDGADIADFANITAIEVVADEAAAKTAVADLAKDAYLVYPDGDATVVVGNSGKLTNSFDGKGYSKFPAPVTP